ncbi:MAG: methyltransferase [Pseudonocardiaceae bacterium]
MDNLTERDRVLLLEQVKDPDTIRILESLPINESSRCLEIGAGMGSIAYWLAARCSRGHVVAVDIDTRNLDPQRSVGTSPYPAMNRYAAAVHQAAQQRGADMQFLAVSGLLSAN